MITFVDITERLQVEEALRESERRLRRQKDLVDLSHDPIFVWDFDGAILEWNRGCEALYGYSAAEAVGKRIEDLLRTTVPGSSFEAVRQVLLRDRAWSGELQQKAKDDRVLFVESRLQLEPIEGHRFVLETSRDIGERKRWEQRQDILVKELNHRVKNVLTMVQAIAEQTAGESENDTNFTELFRGRLAALGSAHDLLVQSDWSGADLSSLVQRELKPYESKRAERLRVAGPPVPVPAAIATPLGLVIHELAVNAAKHGALSVPQGDIEVTWKLDGGADRRLLSLIWRERNGPPVKAGRRGDGSGTALIGRALPDAVIRREFGASGLVCSIELPLPAAAEGRT